MATQPIDYAALAKQYGATSSVPAAPTTPAIDYGALAKQFGGTSAPAPPSAPAGLPAGQSLPGLPAAPPVAMAPSILGRDAAPKGALANLVTGAVKSIPGTLGGIAHLMPGASDAWQPAEVAAQTNGTAQAIGKGIGNAAQFLIPGGAEEKLGAFAAERLPSIAAPLARIGASALGSGTVNAAQGGSFGGGALAGGVSGAAGESLRAIAPLLAETALGVRAPDRAFGRTPGQAIMQETTGVNPGTIASQAEQKVSGYGQQLQNAAAMSQAPVSLLPARQVAKSAYGEAMMRNNPSVLKDMNSLNEQLGSRPGIGVQPQTTGWTGLYQKAPTSPSRIPIPPNVSATEALALKRGIGDLKTSWNPATASDFSSGTVGKVYGALDAGIDAAVPESTQLNQKISSLLPVSQRAGAADLNAGVLQRSISKMARPTGALIGASAGGAAGYKEGGTEGALLGAGLGLVAPEILASPTTLMVGARGMASPVVQRGIIPFARGAALQAPKKKGLYG